MAEPAADDGVGSGGQAGDGLEQAWKQAVTNGTLFQYNPVFYAIAKK